LTVLRSTLLTKHEEKLALLKSVNLNPTKGT